MPTFVQLRVNGNAFADSVALCSFLLKHGKSLGGTDYDLTYRKL